MALVTTTISSRAPIVVTAKAAPTTSELITTPTWGTILEYDIGGTATTITVVRPGVTGAGDPITDLVIGPITSALGAVRVTPEYADPATGSATVLFSQVTAVTARLWRT
jgi:hypothetical protein